MKEIIHKNVNDSALKIAMVGKVIEEDGKTVVPLHIDDVMSLGWAVGHARENGGAVVFTVPKEGRA